MSDSVKWKVEKPKWFPPRVGWKLGESVWAGFRCDEFGKVVSCSVQGCELPPDFFEVLRNDVLPGARAQVSPVAGRFGHKCSDLRQRYLHVVARKLNTLACFPVPR